MKFDGWPWYLKLPQFGANTKFNKRLVIFEITPLLAQKRRSKMCCDIWNYPTFVAKLNFYWWPWYLKLPHFWRNNKVCWWALAFEIAQPSEQKQSFMVGLDIWNSLNFGAKFNKRPWYLKFGKKWSSMVISDIWNRPLLAQKWSLLVCCDVRSCLNFGANTKFYTRPSYLKLPHFWRKNEVWWCAVIFEIAPLLAQKHSLMVGRDIRNSFTFGAEAKFDGGAWYLKSPHFWRFNKVWWLAVKFEIASLLVLKRSSMVGLDIWNRPTFGA